MCVPAVGTAIRGVFQMFKTFIAAGALLAATAVPASAVTFVTTAGSAASFAGPATGTRVDFNGALPTGVTLSGTGYQLATGFQSGVASAPAFGDNSTYLAVGAGGAATLRTSFIANAVSIFLGSVDAFNTVEILNSAGAVIGRFNGAQFSNPANGDLGSAATNLRITFLAAANEAIGGIRFLSDSNALETDNIVFSVVPEPSTWAMMLLGFALVAGTMRVRRQRTRVVYA